MLNFRLHKKENIKIQKIVILPVVVVVAFAEAVGEYDIEEDICA